MSDQALEASEVKLAESGALDGTSPGALVAVRLGPGALRTVWLMARVTFLEAVRRRMLWFAGIAGVAFLALFWAALVSMLHSISPKVTVVNRLEAIGMMTMMVLYAGSMMTSLMAALISCDTLSGEIASGTIHAIATKPVERWCLVLGKWLGFVGMLTLYVLLIEGGSIGLSWFESGYLAHHALAVL